MKSDDFAQELDRVARYALKNKRREVSAELMQPNHPGFILMAMAFGLPEKYIGWVQQNLNFVQGDNRYLCAEWQHLREGGIHLFVYFPYTTDDKVGPRDWLFDLDTQTFNPNWRGANPWP